MQVSVDKTGPCEAKVSLSVPREDFDREYNAALRSSGKNVRMKGFRPGKIPTKILEKEFGEQVRLKAIEFFLNKAFSQAVEENELKPVGHERVPLEEVQLEDGADLNHSFEISLTPDFELGEYKGLTVTDELEPVLDEEIEEAIDDLRLQRSTPEPVGADGLPEDGVAVCHIAWERDGAVILDKDEVRLTSLTPLPGTDADAFREAMVGVRGGDSFELETTVPEDFEVEEHRGQAATCKVTVTEAHRMVPPPEEELWALLNTETEEDFRHLCRERLEMAKQSKENNRQETELMDQLIAAHSFDLPGAMVEAQMAGRRQAIRQQLAQAGVPEEELEAQISTPEHEASTREATEKALTALFLIGEIAQREKIAVEERDLAEEMHQRALQHQASVEDVVKYYREHGLLQQVQVELLERKVRVFLRENGEITES